MVPHNDLLVAQHLHAVRYEDLPPHVTQVIKYSLIDSMGVMLAATTLGEGCQAFADVAGEMGGKPQATVLQGGFRTSAAMAAFANGALGHAVDFENVHDEAIGHPDAASIPAALAMAEMLGNVSGRELIVALALAGDLFSRMSAAITERSALWYEVGIIGAYSAAAAAGKLLRLTPEKMLDAVSFGFMQCSCSWELHHTRRSNVRAIREAFGAKAGVLGALLAQKGAAGFDHPFEGEAGFFKLYAQDKYSSARFMRDLGKRFEGADISFKPYPSCRGTHAIVEAALELKKRHGFSARDIAGMKALGSPYFAFLNQTVEPGTAMDAKFSSRYSVASALLDGELTLRSFTPEALRRPQVLALGKLLAYEADNSVPLQESSNGGMEITLRDGRVLRREMKKPPGHPENPISFEQLAEKFRDCATYSYKPIPDHRLDSFIGDVLALEKLENAGNLMAHFAT